MTRDYQFDLRPGCDAGVPVRLVPGIRRIVARNPSAMTFTGTATYLLGSGSVAVIDPGPRQPAHIDRVLGTLRKGERIEAVFVTHRHLDHSPGADLLRARISAPVYAARPRRATSQGAPPPQLLAAHPGGGEGIDHGFSPDRTLEDGDHVESEFQSNGQPAWSIRAILTPGHLDDHACFASERHAALFTGDHVMGWSSTMVSPPEGDKGVYVESLRRLLQRARSRLDRVYFPGHGHPVENPLDLLQYLLRRRSQRDAQILAAVGERPHDIEDLLRREYQGLNGMQAYAARRMLLAHLIDLERRNQIRIEVNDDGTVRFAPGNVGKARE